MDTYPGSPDISRRPSLRTLTYIELMEAYLGKSKAEIAALRADLQGAEGAYATVYEGMIGTALRVAQGGVSGFVPAEEAVNVQVPLGGPWKSAWVAPVVSGNWYRSYWGSAQGTYPDSTSSWQFGVIGTVDMYWIDSSGYCQTLEPRMNIVPIWPQVTWFRLETASNLNVPNNPPLIMPIPVWFSTHIGINDVGDWGY